MSTFLGQGKGNCFGYVLGVSWNFFMTDKLAEEFFISATLEEADVIGFYSGNSLSHVAKVKKRSTSIDDFLLVSKTSTKTGLYEHTVQEMVEGFAVDEMDKAWKIWRQQSPPIRYLNPRPLKRLKSAREAGF